MEKWKSWFTSIPLSSQAVEHKSDIPWHTDC